MVFLNRNATPARTDVPLRTAEQAVETTIREILKRPKDFDGRTIKFGGTLVGYFVHGQDAVITFAQPPRSAGTSDIALTVGLRNVGDKSFSLGRIMDVYGTVKTDTGKFPKNDKMPNKPSIELVDYEFVIKS